MISNIPLSISNAVLQTRKLSNADRRGSDSIIPIASVASSPERPASLCYSICAGIGYVATAISGVVSRAFTCAKDAICQPCKETSTNHDLVAQPAWGSVIVVDDFNKFNYLDGLEDSDDLDNYYDYSDLKALEESQSGTEDEIETLQIELIPCLVEVDVHQ